MNETEKFVTFVIPGRRRALPSPPIMEKDTPFLAVSSPERLYLRIYAGAKGEVHVQVTYKKKTTTIYNGNFQRNPRGSLERALKEVGLNRGDYIEDDLTRILEKIIHARFAIQDYFADRKVRNDYYQAHERELGKLTAKRVKQ